MEKSKHNIFSKIRDSEQYYIVNLLSGQADILEPEQAEQYRRGKFQDPSVWAAKGYLVEKEAETKRHRQYYLDFQDQRDQDELQLFYVPSYSCNFSCSYCYQDQYETLASQVELEVMNAFFDYVQQEFSGRSKYITLFGGEPLLPGTKRMALIRKFISKANQQHLQLAIVTNGYTINEYFPLLKEAGIREIQITLDGPEEVHNQRRSLKNTKGTFTKIVEGIDLLLKNQINVNLRVVIDQENINYLPDLARFAVKKGWPESRYFKTQLGRNYELHHCQTGNKKLFSRIKMYEALYDLLNKFPEIKAFHQPAFSISKFIFDHQDLPEPLFDSCPGTKTEWAFDYTGNIFACTATVGKEGESLGTFYPEIKTKNQEIENWQERDVLSIDGCSDCAVQLACGGGCAAVAKNKSDSIHTPDCRPVKELLELGINHYFNQA